MNEIRVHVVVIVVVVCTSYQRNGLEHEISDCRCIITTVKWIVDAGEQIALAVFTCNTVTNYFSNNTIMRHFGPSTMASFYWAVIFLQDCLCMQHKK